MAQDPIAPTAPAPSGDQSTGSGVGLDTSASAAPETPAIADQDGISEAPPITEAEIAAAPPGDQARMRGMVATWTKSMMASKAQERKLADMVASLEREQLARQSEAETPEPAPQAVKSLEDQEEEVYKGLDPNVVSLLKKQATLIEERVSRRFQPIAAGAAEARSTAALVAVRARFPDFDQVVPVPFARQVLTQNPGMSLEQVYALADYNRKAGDLNKAKAELTKYQGAEKRRAVTERPGGPSADSLDYSWYEKMPMEQRMRLSSRELHELANKSSR
jgi:hypothetical protein